MPQCLITLENNDQTWENCMTGFLEQFCFQEKPWNTETCLSFPKVNLRPKASGDADFNVFFEYANIF